MKRFGAEARAFLTDFWDAWIGLMSGVFGVLLWAVAAVAEPLPLSARLTFFVFGTAAAVVASFLVWRKAHREARPYDEETWLRAQERFARLSDEDKASLERIAIEKGVPADTVPGFGRLEQASFVKRDQAAAILSLHPEYKMIVPRLVQEWRAART